MISDQDGSPDAASDRITGRQSATDARQRLPGRMGASKAAGVKSAEPSMTGIYMIGAFLVVMAALNLFEFGRLD
jgi:hypothetical protein